MPTPVGAKKPSEDFSTPPELANLDSPPPSADIPSVSPSLLLRLRTALRRTLEERPPAAPQAPRAVRKVLELCQQLLSERGEVSGSRLAGEALAAFSALGPDARASFFDHLAIAFSPDPESVVKAGLNYRNDPSPDNLARLQRVVEPLRRELFRRLNMASGAIAQLVDMR